MNTNKVIREAIKHLDIKEREIKKKFTSYVFSNKSSLDTDEPIIKFYNDKKEEEEFFFQPLAKLYTKENIWIWSWAMPILPKNNQFLSKQILDYGLNITIESIENNTFNLFLKSVLINSRIKINSDNDLLILKALSLYISKKYGILTIDDDDAKDYKYIIIITKKVN